MCLRRVWISSLADAAPGQTRSRGEAGACEFAGDVTGRIMQSAQRPARSRACDVDVDLTSLRSRPDEPATPCGSGKPRLRLPGYIPVLLLRRVEAGPPHPWRHVPYPAPPCMRSSRCHQDPPRSPAVTAPVLGVMSPPMTAAARPAFIPNVARHLAQPTTSLAPGLHSRFERPRGVLVAPRPGAHTAPVLLPVP